MNALRRFKDFGPVLALRKWRYRRKMRQGRGWWWFWGAFDSYDEALTAVPGSIEPGYDSAGPVDLTAYEHMYDFDYPALLWIARFVDELSGPLHIVDLGGHVGSKYRVYRQRWPFPDSLSWTVCETAGTVDAALRSRQEETAPRLSFTSDRNVIDGCGILFASGSLQYLETGLPEILAAVEHRPPRLVLNKVPLSEGPEGWTLQNIGGVAAAPYHVFNRADFLARLAALGYELADEWPVPGRAVRIPFQTRLGTEANSGIALRLADS